MAKEATALYVTVKGKQVPKIVFLMGSGKAKDECAV